ncbi:protein phosphatase 2C domain-containing protein [Spirosoma panaciterrae]|uniref:protein phosphatase 2C domain-containing protein n=1 Tax=Spirosoma panaciterrae TaxID=496058 RepID=UPI0003A7A9D9|nr:protein phosphatase 2C domain-containing protein [Spirosoma panaciterrae]
MASNNMEEAIDTFSDESKRPSILFAGRTHPGRVRQSNQDTFISLSPLWSQSSGKSMFAVIDGVGGYAGGEYAAELARNALEQVMNKASGELKQMLREAVEYANRRIYEERQQKDQYREMGCVLTIVVTDVHAQKLYFAHVGDTRLYRLHQNELTKLTHDHSVIGLLEDAGQLTEAEAMSHPRRNEIIRDVGSSVPVEGEELAEIGEAPFLPGNVVLLCSDGLTDMVDSRSIKSTLSSQISPESQVDELLEKALAAGGRDNITLVLVRNQTCSPTEVKSDQATHEPVATPLQSDADESFTSRSTPGSANLKNRLTWAVWSLSGLCLLLISVVVWLVNQAVPPPVTDKPQTVPIVSRSTEEATLRRLLDQARQSPQRIVRLTKAIFGPTITLTSPIELKDSVVVVGDGTVSITADSSFQGPAALLLSGQRPIILRKLRFNGFPVGIQTATSTYQADSLLFIKTPVPIRYVGQSAMDTLRLDSFRPAIAHPGGLKPVLKK